MNNDAPEFGRYRMPNPIDEFLRLADQADAERTPFPENDHVPEGISNVRITSAGRWGQHSSPSWVVPQSRADWISIGIGIVCGVVIAALIVVGVAGELGW